MENIDLQEQRERELQRELMGLTDLNQDVKASPWTGREAAGAAQQQLACLKN